MFVLGVAPVPAVTAQVIAIDRAVPSPARKRQKGVAVMLGRLSLSAATSARVSLKRSNETPVARGSDFPASCPSGR